MAAAKVLSADTESRLVKKASENMPSEKPARSAAAIWAAISGTGAAGS